MKNKILALIIPALFAIQLVMGQQHSGVKNPAPKKLIDTADVVRSVDVQPSFSGDIAGFRQYLSRNLAYPATAVEEGIEGKVIVEFIVCEDGSLCNERIVKSVGGGCDQEALRVIRAMPAWNPAMKDGKPVKTYFKQPIMFKLAE
mgnify:CR=1 FL=1